MKIGIAVFVGCDGLSPAELGRAVEERGFESLFFAEHTHIPLSSRRDDGRVPSSYAHTWDPFVALGAVSAVTRDLRLGTSVCLVTQRDPIVTAKEVASLDRISGGRFEFGIGAGWNHAELANHGSDARTRMALMADRVGAMKQIWLYDEAEYHGRLVDFDQLWSWPKPVQQPHPPILVGGNGLGAEDRVLAYGDGWMPQCAHLKSVAELTERVTGLRKRAADAGRPRPTVTMFGAVPGMLGEFEDAGVDRCLLTITLESADSVLRQLDKWASLI